ncbi:MAG TPA: STAS domain-containing protein [Stellaceae bacterium]|nr:STAS domain-containing protein [Stellaceae bacterium]
MADETLIVNELAESGATVLELKGRLEVATIALAQDKFADAVASGPPIVLDLAKLAHLSSAGLRLILKTMKQAQASRQPFVISGARGPVKEVLDSIGLRQFCPFARSRAEAIAKLN